MKEKKIGLSLKYKILFLLTIIPVVSLSIYIALATQLFENDKIAYVKDSSVSVAKSLAVQMRTEVNSFVEQIKPIVENYDYNEKKFPSETAALFNKQERVDSLILLQKGADGRYAALGSLKKTNEFADKFIQDFNLLNKVRDEVIGKRLLITNAPFSDMHLVISTIIGDASKPDHVI
ncbi:MAG: hypothetical protein KDD38_11545, partial [Bdellovibrionales bacterium]|nr:hypothetical protein [Bdellovibrionales bacterium]